MTHRILLGAALAFAVAACGGDQAPAPAKDETAASSEKTGEGGAALPPCPFTDTSGWAGSIENGRVLVTGLVDLQMAGFKPGLTPRPGAAGGTLALDLALTPEANAAVTDRARYEGPGGGYRRGEIWCGGERIAQFDMVIVD